MRLYWFLTWLQFMICLCRNEIQTASVFISVNVIDSIIIFKTMRNKQEHRKPFMAAQLIFSDANLSLREVQFTVHTLEKKKPQSKQVIILLYAIILNIYDLIWTKRSFQDSKKSWPFHSMVHDFARNGECHKRLSLVYSEIEI